MSSFYAWLSRLLLAVSVVHAQANSVWVPGDPADPLKLCKYGNTTQGFYIGSQADAAAIMACTTFNSGIILATNESVSLPNLVTVMGSVRTFDSRSPETEISPVSYMTSISFPNLGFIGGDLELWTPHLENLDLSSLTKVEGEITLSAGKLRVWNGSNTLQTSSDLTVLEHNITNLEFRNLRNVTSISIYFTTSDSSLYLKGTPGNRMSISVRGHGDTSFTSDLQDTADASIGISGCQNITVNSSAISTLAIFDNPNLEVLAVPSLTTMSWNYHSYVIMYAGAGLWIRDNDILRSIAFERLTTIHNGLTIENNPQLQILGGTEPNVAFPLLNHVNQSISIVGNFSSVILPSLKSDFTSMSIKSTNTSFDCPTILNRFPSAYCSPNPTPTPTWVPTSEPSDNKHSNTSKIGIGIGVAAGVVLLSALTIIWWIRRSRQPIEQKPPAYQLDNSQAPRQSSEAPPQYHPVTAVVASRNADHYSEPLRLDGEAPVNRIPDSSRPAAGLPPTYQP